MIEIQEAVKALPPAPAHEFCRRFFREYVEEGEISDRALCELGDNLFVALDQEEDAHSAARC